MDETGDTARRSWFRYVTVEPGMFLYMFAFQLTSVVEQELFVMKSCLSNLNYTHDICDNLNLEKNEVFKKNVQTHVSTFHQWNHIAGYIFPVVIALFIGSWSDKRGRKIPLLIGLTGKLIYVLALLLNIHYEKWPVEYIIYTATIPSALTGVDIVVFASSFAYISDVSSTKNRTLRITILELSYLVTLPTGIALGSYLFKYVFDQSYTIMFSINAVFVVSAILYSAFCLKWRTSLRQAPISEVDGCGGIVGDFFDGKHVADTIRTLLRKRANHCRTFLWILLLSMFFYTFQRDERSYTYLYTKYKFGWDTEKFSNFKVFQSASYLLILFIGVPIMTRLLKWPDTIIAMFGSYCFALARVFFALAEVPEIFYLGAAISSIGPVGGPLIRSMASKVVPSSERGKVFAMLSVCDNAVPLVSSVLYTQIYNMTLGKFPGFFILTAATQIILFFLMLSVHIVLKRSRLSLDQISLDSARNDATNNIVNDTNTNDSSDENKT